MQKLILFIFVFLFCFSLPNPVSACDCAKISSVKANMHTFQTMLETYAVDHGKYPTSTQELKKAAVKKGYWKEFKSPFTNKSGYNKSYGDFFKLSINPNTHQLESPEYRFFFGLRVVRTETIVKLPEKGVVLYEYISTGAYRIYGTKIDSQLIIDRGDIFFLSNEK